MFSLIGQAKAANGGRLLKVTHRGQHGYDVAAYAQNDTPWAALDRGRAEPDLYDCLVCEYLRILYIFILWEY